MIEKTTVVKNPHGLHARPAARFVQISAAFGGDVSLVKGDKEVNAKSILSVMGLGVEPGSEVTIRLNGDGGEVVLSSLAAILEDENL